MMPSIATLNVIRRSTLAGTPARGFADDVTGNDDPERVAEARNEANERVEAKPKTRTRQHEGAVEQPGKTG